MNQIIMEQCAMAFYMHIFEMQVTFTAAVVAVISVDIFKLSTLFRLIKLYSIAMISGDNETAKQMKQ